MSTFLPENQTQGLPSTSQSTNNGQSLVAHALRRLSISTASATPLPASSPRSGSASPRTYGQKNYSSSNSSLPPPRSPLHRSPSSMSSRSRSSTPTLLRKASMNSLHGVGGVTPSRSSPARRSSSQFTNASTMVGKEPLVEEDATPPSPKHTASSIASNHFAAELEIHNKEDQSVKNPDTIVILHDSCYGHRYSRPRTSKASLSTIVERPERIHASILGLSVAYVRLGERHAEGQHALHHNKDPSTIPTMPFKIRKTTRKLPLSSQAITNVHGTKWMEELKIMCDNAESRLAMNGKELTRPDMNRGADQDAPAKFHEGDLYLCSESLDAMEGALGAVCEGVDAVFQGAATGKGPHRTFVAIRPPGHHCSASYPSGFCWLNNVHVGISHAALTHGLTHAAIIDFDLHHGDGSQSIAWDSNKRAFNAPKNALPWKKTSIGYFSLHDINSYPCEMGDEEKVKNASLCIENAHGQSIWNVHLQPWKSEAEFWSLYENKYSILLEKTRNFLKAQTERLRLNPNGPKPKSAIFLSAGFDASEWESSGMQRHKVNVPTEFYARLTSDVVKLAAEEGTAAEGRVISVLEGGYSDRALCTGVFSHLSGMAAGDPIIISKEISPNGLAYEMVQKIGAFDGTKDDIENTVTLGAQTYDPSWWSLPYLEQLDAVMNPPPAPIEPKKVREHTPTFSSPTQSFIAKVTSPNARQTISRMSNHGYSKPVSRNDSPPPPEVPWTVAAHELSKLLIPTDRQTKSCKPEDLSAEATRARRDRQSIVTPPTAAPEANTETTSQRMALRTRKPAKALVESVEEAEVKKPVSKANRRKTVAGAAHIAAEQAGVRSTTPKPEPGYAKPTNQSSRRLSSASASGSVTSETTYVNGQSRKPSNPTSHFQRSGTSQSVRPDSSMSSRGHSIPPVVKKARAPAQPKPDAPKTSRPRRKSPLNGHTGTDGSMDPPSRSSSSTLLPTTEPSSKNSDIEELTSSMKKITLTLLTKSQREARERDKKAAAAAAKPASNKGTKAGPLKIAPKKESRILPPSKSHSTSRSPPASTPETQLPALPSSPQLPAPIPTHLQMASSIPLPASSPPVSPRFRAPPPAQPQRTSSDMFIPYQPEGPTPSIVTQTEPLKWLPPNTTATPSPMKRGELPVFSPTGAIPFAPAYKVDVEPKRENEAMEVDTWHAMEVDIWEVPETPGRS